MRRGMARKRRNDTRRRIALLAIAGGLAAALGAAGARLAGGRSGKRLAGLARRRPKPETYACTSCGTVYRVSGVDRHRVYWLEEAAESDPVLGTDCVRCGTPLPAGHAMATT